MVTLCFYTKTKKKQEVVESSNNCCAIITLRYRMYADIPYKDDYVFDVDESVETRDIIFYYTKHQQNYVVL